MGFAKYFKKQGWMSLGVYYATHPKKLKALVNTAKKYSTKEGLKTVKDELILILEYVRDSFTGRYKDYSLVSLISIIAAIVYVVTPVDVIPDIIPTGLIDDAAILLWATKEFSAELDKYKAFVRKFRGSNASSTIEDADYEEICDAEKVLPCK